MLVDGLDRFHKGYVAKLFAKPRVVRWINANRQEHLSEFQMVAEIKALAVMPIAAKWPGR